MMPSEASFNMARWRDNPVLFVREQFDAEPDDWQAEILHEFKNNQRLAMKAAKGCGKSTILAWCSWYFLATREHPKIAATSISWDNLSDGLWTEMAKWQIRSPFLKDHFTWTKTRIHYNASPATWWMSARTWAKGADSSQQADTLAGLHADNLLFVLDEAGGIPDGVMAAAEAGLATGEDTKIIMAGNPTHLEGPLYRAATSERHLWYLAEITGDPDNPKRAKRISIEWAREQIAKYGVDSPWVLVNVFGRFPPSSINSLLGPDEIRDAMDRYVKPEFYDFSQKRLGIDVARFGTDSTVIFPRQGLQAFKFAEMKGARSEEIAARVMAAKSRWDSEIEFVDGTGGFGAGVIDALHQAHIPAKEIHFSGKPIDPRYLNKRAEMWFLLAEWVKRGGSLPNNPELARELSAPTYTFQNGKFKLEEKEQIKARLGFSPDRADALALTFALPEMPKKSTSPIKQQMYKMQTEYDPFSDSRFKS